MSTTIYLIRHAEAGKAWNEDPDPALSEKGQLQALQLARYLQEDFYHENIQIWSSPLTRAQQTASALPSAFDLKPAFAELPSPGIPLAKRSAWLKGLFSKEWPELDLTLHDWKKTMLQAFQKIEQDTIIFSHFMVLNTLVGWINQENKLVHFYPDYCSVTKIEKYGEQFRVLELGSQMDTLLQ